MSLDRNLFTLRLTCSSTGPSILDLVDPAGNIHYRKQKITGPVYVARVYDYVSQSLLVTATAPSASSKVKILELRNPSVPVELKCLSRPAVVATSTSPSHLRPKPTPTTTDRRAVSELFPSTHSPVSQSVLSPPRGALVVKPPAPALATNPTVASTATSTPPRPRRSSSRPSQSQFASASPAQTTRSGARTLPASHPEPQTLSAAARIPSQRDFKRDMSLTPPAMTYSSSSPDLRAYAGAGLSGESTSHSHPPPPRLNTWNGSDSDPDPDSDPAYRSEKLVLTPPPLPPRRTSTNGATRPRIEITEIEDAAPVAGPSRSRRTRVSDDDLAAPPTYTELPIEGEFPIG